MHATNNGKLARYTGPVRKFRPTSMHSMILNGRSVDYNTGRPEVFILVFFHPGGGGVDATLKLNVGADNQRKFADRMLGRMGLALPDSGSEAQDLELIQSSLHYGVLPYEVHSRESGIQPGKWQVTELTKDASAVEANIQWREGDEPPAPHEEEGRKVKIDLSRSSESRSDPYERAPTAMQEALTEARIDPGALKQAEDTGRLRAAEEAIKLAEEAMRKLRPVKTFRGVVHFTGLVELKGIEAHDAFDAEGKMIDIVCDKHQVVEFDISPGSVGMNHEPEQES